jgi:DGQHR domain-containing protein
MDLFALKFSQVNGRYPLIATAIRAADLIDLAEVDKRTPSNPDGYQRELRRQRLSEVAHYLSAEEGILPGSIITALRAGADWSFVGMAANEAGEVGTLRLVPGTKLWIIDGQHRLYGIEHAMNQSDDDRAETLGNMVLPLVILPDISRIDEMRVFFVVNDRQKAVPTDLVDHLLLDSMAADRISTPRELSRAQATEIAVLLTKQKGGPWYQRIRIPDEAPLRSYQVKLHPFVASLQEHLAKDGILETYVQADPATAAKIVSNYWEAIRTLLPDAFQNPDDYSLQRTPGLYSLHMLLPDVLRLCEQMGDATVENFASVLDNVRLLKHAYRWSTKDKERADPLTLGTNMRLLRMLRDEMRTDLPRPKVTV